MSSPAERGLVSRYIWLMIFLFAGLLFLQGLLQGAWGTDVLHGSGIKALLTSIIPNLIAALLGALLVYFFIRKIDHAKYLGALHPVRAVLQDLRRDNKISPDAVQDVMVRVVRAASLLYFGGQSPLCRRVIKN
jgi:hypothetical protein